MFGRLATMRIKAADNAFASGRIDEAFDAVSSDDLSKHPRIVEIRQKLGAAFMVRGQERLLSRQFSEALTDFEKAGRCGFEPTRIAEWRRRATEAFESDRGTSAERDRALAEARERAAAGSLAGAREALNRVEEAHPMREAVAGVIERQMRQASEALAAAIGALDRDDLAAASKQVRMARKLYAGLEGLSSAETRLADRAVEKARSGFASGRLDRAKADLASLNGIESGSADRREMEELLRQAGEASAALSKHDYSQASLALGRLAKMEPKMEWITEARDKLDTVEDALQAVMEGPLGLLSPVLTTDAKQRGAVDASALQECETQAAAPRRDGRRVFNDLADDPGCLNVPANGLPANQPPTPPNVPGIPRRLLLRMDGVGSFLLVRGDRIGIGRAGQSATADIPLVSDLSERQADIVRAGEDYFVVSQGGVELAGSHVDHALLQDGDRIRLGKRIRLRFKRPSLKSSTATLELGDGVRMENDCRRIVLWSGPILIGGSRECHIGAMGSTRDLVLLERGGRIYVKQLEAGSQPVFVDLGEPIDLCGLRFTVTVLASPTGVGRVMG